MFCSYHTYLETHGFDLTDTMCVFSLRCKILIIAMPFIGEDLRSMERVDHYVRSD